ncbi:MAG: glycoside hydrolase family 88 protein [Vicinamibacteria bacterium]|nr:glycoside hydrolase family 88 protein [Vicinamibacteria bacterium]
MTRLWTCAALGATLSLGVAADDASPRDWAVRTAQSVMQRTPDPLGLDEAGGRQRWNYTQGLMLQAILAVGQRTGDARYADYVERYYGRLVREDGSIEGYRPHIFNIDHVNPGKTLLRLHQQRPQPRYKAALDLVRSQLREHPRTREGGYWHKQIYPHQMWLDGLYMGATFEAEYAAAFGEAAAFDDVVNQFVLMEKVARDAKTGLLYHAWDESRGMRWADAETGRSPHFWGRAMGWYAMGLVDALEFLPEDHARRGELVAVLGRLVEAVAKVQDKGGAWWQVLDQAGREGNYREASATAMFTYSIAKGVRLGALDAEHLATAKRGWAAMLREFVTTDAAGLVDVNRICIVAGLGGLPYRSGSYEYYVNEKIGSNDPKAVGPFVLAALEFDALGR